MEKLKLIFIFALFFISINSKANSFKVSNLNDILGQTSCRYVSGKITDCATGQPIAGALVYAGNISTMTDIEGFYSICLPLVFTSFNISYVGFRSVKITVNGRVAINECLREEM